MSGRLLSREDYNRLKASLRRLVRTAGGVECAASIVGRVSKTQIQRYYSPAEGECFPPIDVIADLEHDTGEPIVTRALCDMAGGYFVPVNTLQEKADFCVYVADIGKEVSDVMARVSSALQDGEISESENVELRAEIKQAIDALAAAYGHLEKGA